MTITVNNTLLQGVAKNVPKKWDVY